MALSSGPHPSAAKGPAKKAPALSMPTFGKGKGKAPKPAPAAGAAAPKKPSLFGRIASAIPFSLRSSSQNFTRRHTRHDCCVVATLLLIEKKIPLDGLVLEISQGGVLFRTASVYILDRTGEEARVEFAGYSATGIIVASRDIGYGIRFAAELPEEMVDDVVSRFSYRIGERPFGSELADGRLA